MKKFLVCLIFVLLLSSDINSYSVKYYVHVYFTNGQSYEEYVYPCYLEVFLEDFIDHEYIESIFISRSLCVYDQY